MSDPNEHPLFPATSENADPPRVSKINIARFDPIKGTSPFIPRLFDAAEIRDLSQIAEMFGGGRYELVGRDEHRIVARRSYEIAGESKPLVQEVPKPVHDTVPSPALPPPAQSGMGFGGFAAMLPIVVPIILQYLQNAAAERREQQTQNQAMYMNMMQQQQASSQAFIQAMSNLNKGSGSSEDFRAGIAWAENFIAGKMEAAAEGGGETDAAEIMKTIGQAFEMMKLTGGPPAAGAT